MTFNEANAVEEFLLNRLTGLSGLHWTYVHGPALERSTADVMVEPTVRDALIRLNPEIAESPDRADEVIYKLRGVILGVTGAGLVSCNEEFMSWLRGDRTMPFGPAGEHVTIRLIDFEVPSNNTFVVSNQVTCTAGPSKRYDIVGFVNGLPLVLGEAKTPVRPAVTWVDGAAQVHDDYEVNTPGFFVPNVFSFATEGKEYRFGSIRMPLQIWAPWRAGKASLPGLGEIELAASSMLRPDVVLDITRNFTTFGTDGRGRKIKLIARYQQYEGTNQIQRLVIAREIGREVDGEISSEFVLHPDFIGIHIFGLGFR